MIYSDLFDLQEYITSECKVMCEIGDRDLGEDEYPFVKIIPDLEFNIYYFTKGKNREGSNTNNGPVSN